MSEIQHVNVKIFAEPGSSIPWHDLIPVFHRWIQTSALPEMLIDVTDYAHVPAGPGVMLIGHEAWYSVDNREARPGLLYNRRTTIDGSTADKLAQAYDAAATAASKLEQEPEFRSGVRFNPFEFEIAVNDRMLAPNTPATFEFLRPSIDAFLQARFGQAGRVDWVDDPRSIFRVRVSAG